jgi:hypothetical protein
VVVVSDGVPQTWRIKWQDQGLTGRGDDTVQRDSILLGDAPDDQYRIEVVVTGMGEDDPEVESAIVYPCADCGWANDCPEGCHS